MNTCPACRHANPVGTPLCSRCGAKLEAKARELSQDLADQLLALIQDGHKIEATKLFREHTGCGLIEARRAVESLEQGTLPSLADENQEDWKGEVLAQLTHRRKIAAIKIYREHTGLGLKESKEAVEKMAAEHGIKPATGCSTSAAVAVLVLLGLYALS